MKAIAIIPARGGSKRFPNKNTALFNGLPLIAHSILFAQEYSDIICDIIVSTDDVAIKKIAIDFGATVIDRPPSISGDFEPTISALKHVVENTSTEHDAVVLLQPTNPLRPSFLLPKAFEIFGQLALDSLFTVSRDYHKLGKIIHDRFVPFNYKIGQRSQDLEPLYYENGLLYICQKELILNDILIGLNHFPLVVDHPFAAVDIDTYQDLIFAEHIMNSTTK